MTSSLSEFAWAAARRIARLPPLAALRRRRYERKFSALGRPARLFRGIYPNFAAATASVPRAMPVGYNNEASAHLLEDERHEIFPTDYPVLFWLDRLIQPGSTLFDVGGNVGSRYLAFRRLLEYPGDFSWIVHDLPAVVALGAEIAAQERAPHLKFSTDFTDLARADIILASGVLQFLDDWSGFLRNTAHKPRHLLINRTSVYHQPGAVTLHSTGTTFCPYHLFNRAEFVATLEGLGYELRDEWANPGIGCYIPFHPEHSFGSYSGFYFTRPESAQPA